MMGKSGDNSILRLTGTKETAFPTAETRFRRSRHLL
jgi:hypothetical protein